MSVAIYYQDELEGLWHACGGADELRDVILELGRANRLAYRRTYGEAEDMDFVLERPREAPDRWGANVSVQTWASNLIYNCVSNGGKDFAPPKRACALLAAARKADKAASPIAG